MEPLPPAIESQLASTAGAERPLYSIRQVGWVSWVGGPLAGAFVLERTLARTGRPERGPMVWSMGALLTALTMLAAMVAPTGLPNAVIPGAGAAVWAFVADRMLGREFRHHVPRGRASASFWRALGVGLLFSPVSLVLFLAASSVIHLDPINRWASGENEIYYERLATRADAERLGGFLREEGFFTDDSAWTVTLREELPEQVVISILVTSEAVDDEAFVADLDTLRKHVFGVLYSDGSVHFELRNFLGATLRRIPR